VAAPIVQHHAKSKAVKILLIIYFSNGSKNNNIPASFLESSKPLVEKGVSFAKIWSATFVKKPTPFFHLERSKFSTVRALFVKP
jgi:hypothetical protein